MNRIMLDQIHEHFKQKSEQLAAARNQAVTCVEHISQLLDDIDDNLMNIDYSRLVSARKEVKQLHVDSNTKIDLMQRIKLAREQYKKKRIRECVQLTQGKKLCLQKPNNQGLIALKSFFLDELLWLDKIMPFLDANNQLSVRLVNKTMFNLVSSNLYAQVFKKKIVCVQVNQNDVDAPWVHLLISALIHKPDSSLDDLNFLHALKSSSMLAMTKAKHNVTDTQYKIQQAVLKHMYELMQFINARHSDMQFFVRLNCSKFMHTIYRLLSAVHFVKYGVNAVCHYDAYMTIDSAIQRTLNCKVVRLISCCFYSVIVTACLTSSNIEGDVLYVTGKKLSQVSIFIDTPKIDHHTRLILIAVLKHNATVFHKHPKLNKWIRCGLDNQNQLVYTNRQLLFPKSNKLDFIFSVE